MSTPELKEEKGGAWVGVLGFLLLWFFSAGRSGRVAEAGEMWACGVLTLFFVVVFVYGPKCRRSRQTWGVWGFEDVFMSMLLCQNYRAAPSFCVFLLIISPRCGEMAFSFGIFTA